MAIELFMPALSPTMEEGTLAKWLVKEGDTVKSGDILAEIETDKATMEFESIDDGVMGKIRARELGFAACMHMLHKTVGAPKGGGGSAGGGYGLRAVLAPLLPTPVRTPVDVPLSSPPPPSSFPFLSLPPFLSPPPLLPFSALLPPSFLLSLLPFKIFQVPLSNSGQLYCLLAAELKNAQIIFRACSENARKMKSTSLSHFISNVSKHYAKPYYINNSRHSGTTRSLIGPVFRWLVDLVPSTTL